MKLILSRKGFDSSAGGGPSPILPDGTLLSLPIPSDDALSYDQIRAPDGRPLGRIMDELGIRREPGCHLDPDLQRESLSRRRGWRPAFGSVGAAGRHLQDQGVGPGDLFLFFGWFRPVRHDGTRLRFAAGPDLHVIFGYLQVGRVWDVGRETRLPAWLSDHPHAADFRRDKPGNVVYASSGRLDLPGLGNRSAAGTLGFAPSRVLTAPGRSRSRWALPPAVFRGRSISYHRQESWRPGYFQSAARGQEFVVQADDAIRAWAAGIITADGALPDAHPATRT